MACLKILDPQVRAIISSAYCSNGEMANSAGLGFAAAVSKPYTLDELAAAVHAVAFA
jgi:DNA-binding NarL/FixJ family response regulator